MSENNTVPKTFKEIGIIFEEDKECQTCSDGSCHNTTTSKINNKEYNVHISTNFETNDFQIHASIDFNTSSDDDISEYFEREEEAVKFVCTTFNGFGCF